LIHQVFQAVIESRWDPEWATLLQDRGVPLRQRLVEFYQHYLDAIDDGIWIRIVMYASLDGLDMTRRYIAVHIDDLLATIAAEASAAGDADHEIDPELVWGLHSTLIYYLVRKHIHATPVTRDRAAVVVMAVDSFVDGLDPKP
jgi:AcrR family transcriptional regulator